MRGVRWLLVVLVLAPPAPAGSQELRGFVVLEGDPGYLTNAYLDPGFATWAPEVETAFGSTAGTGLLEWSGDRTTASVAAAARWMGFADSTPAWRAYRFSGGVERRLGDRVALGADLSFSDIRRPTRRETLWGQAALRWTASPRVRLSLGPGLARRRFPATAAEEDGGLLDPPLGGDDPGDASSSTEAADATSYLLFAGLEAWTGRRWRIQAEAYGAHTEASDLGIDYRGGGGSLRFTRWFRNGASVSAGAGLEGFGYRAAVETADGTPVEVPEDDLIWRGDLGAGWPLGRRAELRARVAGLGRSGADGEATGAEATSADVYASLGVRLTLGGALAGPRAGPPLWERTAAGMRIRVRYDGPGRLYLAGDFNAWADPGLPLRPEGGAVHTATLELPPGSYRYRIRVLEGGSERWLELPKETPSVEDGFGGRNGLLVVGEDPATTERERRDELSETI